MDFTSTTYARSTEVTKEELDAILARPDCKWRHAGTNRDGVHLALDLPLSLEEASFQMKMLGDKWFMCNEPDILRAR